MDWQIPTGQNLEKNKNRMVPLTHNSEGIVVFLYARRRLRKNKENEEEFVSFQILLLMEKKEGGRGRGRGDPQSYRIGISVDRDKDRDPSKYMEKYSISHVAPQKTRIYIYIVVVSMGQTLLFVRINANGLSKHMFNLFLAVSPEIFLINATFILLIHGVRHELVLGVEKQAKEPTLDRRFQLPIFALESNPISESFFSHWTLAYSHYCLLSLLYFTLLNLTLLNIRTINVSMGVGTGGGGVAYMELFSFFYFYISLIFVGYSDQHKGNPKDTIFFFFFCWFGDTSAFYAVLKISAYINKELPERRTGQAKLLLQGLQPNNRTLFPTDEL
ncbi:hypothetical protein ACJX0J_020620, partial [Zea mays]